MEGAMREWIQRGVLLLCVAAQVLSQECVKPCVCPVDLPECRAGVPRVLDGCGCCQVCARQKGDTCSERHPCDTHRGLQCDYSSSLLSEPGECVGQEDLGCELNGVTYSEGQSFQPSCDWLCRCRGGGVSCVPVCPITYRLQTPDCPAPQFVRLPGRCCREWVCESLDNTVIQDSITARQPPALWPSLSRSHPLNRPGSLAPPCVDRSTQWSVCSQSCGAGLSTRVSNQNAACRLQWETRLCKVRPCNSFQTALRKPLRGQKGVCKASYPSPGPVHLMHQGCYSRPYQLTYCGHCTDSRCCTPHHTTTTPITFYCPSGGQLQRAVMMIHSCVCHNNCPYAPYSNPALWGSRP